MEKLSLNKEGQANKWAFIFIHEYEKRTTETGWNKLHSYLNEMEVNSINVFASHRMYYRWKMDFESLIWRWKEMKKKFGIPVFMWTFSPPREKMLEFKWFWLRWSLKSVFILLNLLSFTLKLLFMESKI